jgi:hypothetical protein
MAVEPLCHCASCVAPSQRCVWLVASVSMPWHCGLPVCLELFSLSG